MKKYEFHPAALQEYAEAVQFFAQQDKQQDFIDTIEKAIFRIIEAPERWTTIKVPLNLEFLETWNKNFGHPIGYGELVREINRP